MTSTILDIDWNDYDDDGWAPVRLLSMNSPALHFHVETSGRDCDGGHGDERIHYGWGDETGRAAWNAYVAMMVRFFGRNDEEGHVMRRRTDTDGMAELTFGGRTDEGYRWVRAYTCTDQCRGRRTYVYDEYAQAAGY